MWIRLNDTHVRLDRTEYTDADPWHWQMQDCLRHLFDVPGLPCEDQEDV